MKRDTLADAIVRGLGIAALGKLRLFSHGDVFHFMSLLLFWRGSVILRDELLSNEESTSVNV